MKKLIFFNLIFIVVVCVYCVNNQRISRSKRAAYDLTDGWYLLINAVNPIFNCNADGYYADIANGCQLYHVCQFLNNQFSKPRFLQYTFICGNGTIFNQLTMTCTRKEESIPCEMSADFFYLNNRVGALKTNFLADDDMIRADNMKLNSKRTKLESPANANRALNTFKFVNPIAAEDEEEEDENSLDEEFK